MARSFVRSRVGACIACLCAVVVLMVSISTAVSALDSDLGADNPSEPLEVVEPTNSLDGSSPGVFDEHGIAIADDYTVYASDAFSSRPFASPLIDTLYHLSGSWVNAPGGAIDCNIIFNDEAAYKCKIFPRDEDISSVYIYFSGAYSSSNPSFTVDSLPSGYDIRFRVYENFFQFSYRLSNSTSYTWSDYQDFLLLPSELALPSSIGLPIDTTTTIFLCSLFLAVIILIKR